MPPRTLVKGGGAGGKPLGWGRGWGPRISMVRGRPRERGQWSGGEGGMEGRGWRWGMGSGPGPSPVPSPGPGPGQGPRKGEERRENERKGEERRAEERKGEERRGKERK